ncbi:dihydrolipoamide acetyltransferase family protein [Mameliella sp. AT18]|uniref:dihydrolipoamide acetyltransferase family protein n=1 Tax=Mameliella sp. AT18 TaxID=3028385 RepID=UPI00237B9631|nr:dihydrolipoamide acetyltransferase family protein [Mameliella sp. AT18]MDD9731273.1 dihydrolipoamide acetyltransferase family protein [Mameliella sp. AT18]
MAVFRMPSLGADMEDGKLVDWLVHPGDTVHRGDVVAVVETQKGAIEIEVFEDGVVERIDAGLGQTFPVGAPLAVIRDAGEPAGPGAVVPGAAVERSPVTEPSGAPAPSLAPSLPTGPAAKPPAAASGVSAASPAARVRAEESGIDLSTLRGSGPGGAVLLRDVEVAMGDAAPAPARRGLDFAAMREAIAATMTRAKREIPHYYLDHEIDLQAAQNWLEAHNAGVPPDQRLLMGALLISAVVRAAGKEMALNGHYANGRYAPSTVVNVGVAVALRGGGLIAPAIMDAGTKTLDEIMAAMRDLVLRARAGRLKGSEMTEGTITVSSLGEGGVDSLTGIIYPPQVALVGFGSPRLVSRVVAGEMKPRTCVQATLSGDHRANDGRTGARFLARIDQLLQEPEAL